MTRMLLGMIAGALLLTPNLGCQSLTSTSFSSLWEESGPVGKPTEIGAIWQDGVDVQLDAQHGGMPIAGFAGRIFFMQSNKGQPAQTVLINSPLQIMLFDDKPVQGPPVPLETWTIKPEHLQLLVKKDMTGWGYSVWLPWNTYNPSIRSVTMTVQYTNPDGTKLQGEPTVIQIRDTNKKGTPRPELKTEQFQNKTWLPQQ